jgi:hypothetical protein
VIWNFGICTTIPVRASVLFSKKKLKNNNLPMMFKYEIPIFLISLLFITQISCDSVCDEELLILELKQDLEDNGVLDCLRYFINNIELSNLQMVLLNPKNKRIND